MGLDHVVSQSISSAWEFAGLYCFFSMLEIENWNVMHEQIANHVTFSLREVVHCNTAKGLRLLCSLFAFLGRFGRDPLPCQASQHKNIKNIA